MAACWSCQADVSARALCPLCGKVQPLPPGATHFDVFALKPSYELDTTALDKSYRELSMKLHPDKFTSAEARERRFSLEQTSALNEAYKTLKDPVRRAFYLLKLHGTDLDKEDAGAQKDMPLEFLEEVMELREELDAAKRKKDVMKAQQMGSGVETRRKAALAAGVSALKTGAFDTASHELGRVRYFQRFLEEVSAIEEESL